MWKWSISLLILCCGLVSCSAEKTEPKPASNPYGSGQYTLSIIKPNAVENQQIGAIIDRFEQAGMRIAGMKMLQLSRAQAENFYDVHQERPFFNDLVSFMISGPVVVMVLEGDNAITRNREIMGATDPSKAASGTIRADFGDSVQANAVHGSDAVETAQREIAFFFTPNEIMKLSK